MPNRFSALHRKEYAVIRFHRHGVLAPDYAILSTQEALLARIQERAEQGYSFAFWLKNLQTYGSYFSAKGRTALLYLRTQPCQRASKTSIVDRRIKKCRTMKTNNNISIRRGRAAISSLNRIKRVLLWAVGIIGAILGLVLWVFLRPIFRGVGWVVSLISALMVIYWLLTL